MKKDTKRGEGLRVTVKRTERGWPGHCIVAYYCLFRRNTLLEGGGQAVVVSTVGHYFTSVGKKKKAQEIGYDRYYETMAWRASRQGAYLDADVHAGELSFDAPCAIDKLTDGSDNDANAMHEAVVAEFTARIERGEDFASPPAPDPTTKA